MPGTQLGKTIDSLTVGLCGLPNTAERRRRVVSPLVGSLMISHSVTNDGHLEDDVRVKALDENVAAPVDVAPGGGPDPDFHLQGLVGLQVAVQVHFRYGNEGVRRTVAAQVDEARVLPGYIKGGG